MNSDHPPTTRLQELCESARAHRAPPDLWPAIAGRASSRRGKRPWLVLASLVAGAVLHLSAVNGMQSSTEAEAELAPILSAAVLDAGRLGAEPLASQALLRHLSTARTRRSR